MSLKNKSILTCPLKSISDGSSDFWTVSASGTNEYYYNQSDVPIKPLNVQENGADMTGEGTLGSLAVGEWAWGDNDTIGNDTIYVRLNSGTPDPDANPADWVKCSEPLLVFQATVALETIILSAVISNTANSTAKTAIVITDSVDIAKAVWLIEVTKEDSIVEVPQKIVLDAEDKLKFMSSLLLVGLFASEDES